MNIDELLTAIEYCQAHPGQQSLKVVVEQYVRRRLGGVDAWLGEQRFVPTDRPTVAGPPITVAIPLAHSRDAQSLVVWPNASRSLGPVEHHFLERVAAAYASATVRAMQSNAVGDDQRVRDGAAPLIGHSPAMQRLRDRMGRVAATDFTTLIEGESGTGKELVARQIHDLSARRQGPFVAVNCAAIVETLLEAELFGIEDRTATGVRGRRGRFEQASGGTLFLDEIADLSASGQAKLLRVIQELSVERVGSHQSHHVDTRIIVATNRSLQTLAVDGKFREDLYYRLAGMEIVVPPLRSRREDIPELARYFLGRHRRIRAFDLTQRAADALSSYDWPGNVRELERMVESAVTLATGNALDLDDLPQRLRAPYVERLWPSLEHQESLREWSRRYVSLVYQHCGENKRETCRMLGISYHTLQAYLRRARASRSSTSDVAPASPAPDVMSPTGVAADRAFATAVADGPGPGAPPVWD